MNKKSLGFIVLMVVSWSLYFVLCKICIMIFESPFIVGLLLRIGTFIFLSLYLKNTGKKFRIGKKAFILIIFIGMLVFLFDAWVNIGFQYVSVSIGTVLLKTEILFVLLISVIILKIKIKKENYLYITLMLLGVILCMDVQASDVRFNEYNILFIMSAALNAGCAFIIKNIQRKYRIDSFMIAYINNIVSLVLYTICSFFFEKSHIMDLILVVRGKWLILIFFVSCSICQTCLMITYYRNLEVLPVWIVKTSLLFVPALSMVIEIIFLHAAITLLSLLGFLLVLLGGLGIIINSKSVS